MTYLIFVVVMVHVHIIEDFTVLCILVLTNLVFVDFTLRDPVSKFFFHTFRAVSKMCRLDDHLYKKISIPGLCVFSTHQLNVDISCQQIQNKSTQITKLWDKKVPFLQICGLFSSRWRCKCGTCFSKHGSSAESCEIIMSTQHISLHKSINSVFASVLQIG